MAHDDEMVLMRDGLDGEVAWVRGRLAGGFPSPHVEPKFRLRDDDAYCCIGSCFARVIERQLRP